MLYSLKEKQLIDDDDYAILESSLPEESQELFKNVDSNGTKSHGRSYIEEVKRFAMCFFFIPQRPMSMQGLPHSNTIHSWTKFIEGNPGFKEVFICLKFLTEQIGERMLCSLILDEMSIRKQLCFDSTSKIG